LVISPGKTYTNKDLLNNSYEKVASGKYQSTVTITLMNDDQNLENMVIYAKNIKKTD